MSEDNIKLDSFWGGAAVAQPAYSSPLFLDLIDLFVSQKLSTKLNRKIEDERKGAEVGQFYYKN